MSTKLGESFWEIAAKKAAGFDAAFSGATAAVLRVAAAAVKVGAVFAVAFAGRGLVALKTQEDAALNLRGALALTGQEVGGNSKRLTEFARTLSSTSDHFKALDVQAAIASETLAGIPVGQAEIIVARAAALAQATGRDLGSTTAALSEYYKGNRDALDGVIVGLNTARSAGEKKLLIDKALKNSSQQFSVETGGLSRQLRDATERFDMLAAALVGAVLPAVNTLLAGVESLTFGTGEMTEKQRTAMLAAVDFAVGLVAIAVVAPKVVSGMVVMGRAGIALFGVWQKLTKVQAIWAASTVAGVAVAAAAWAALDALGVIDTGPLDVLAAGVEKIGSGVREMVTSAAAAVTGPVMAAGKAAEKVAAEGEAKRKAMIDKRINAELKGIRQIQQAQHGFETGDETYRRQSMERNARASGDAVAGKAAAEKADAAAKAEAGEATAAAIKFNDEQDAIAISDRDARAAAYETEHAYAAAEQVAYADGKKDAERQAVVDRKAAYAAKADKSKARAMLGGPGAVGETTEEMVQRYMDGNGTTMSRKYISPPAFPFVATDEERAAKAAADRWSSTLDDIGKIEWDGGVVDVQSDQLGALAKLQEQQLSVLKKIAGKTGGPGQ